MTVLELKRLLDKYPDDIEIIMKKTKILGNIGFINSVRQDILRKDTYVFLGEDIPCVLLSDEVAKVEGRNNLCTQRYCLKNHNSGTIECDEECNNRTTF